MKETPQMRFGDERVVFVFGNGSHFRFRPYIKHGPVMAFYYSEPLSFPLFDVGEYIDTIEEAIMRAKLVFPGLRVYVPRDTYIRTQMWRDLSMKIYDGWRISYIDLMNLEEV